MTERRYMEEVGSRLGMAIEARGMTKAAVAEELGISASLLGHWIAGRHYPNPFKLREFCNRHGITADWIYREQVFSLPRDVADALWAAKAASPPAERAEHHHEPERGTSAPKTRQRKPRKR